MFRFMSGLQHVGMMTCEGWRRATEPTFLGLDLFAPFSSLSCFQISMGETTLGSDLVASTPSASCETHVTVSLTLVQLTSFR